MSNTQMTLENIKGLSSESTTNPILYDGLSYEAANPDDCILFAGPARYTPSTTPGTNYEIIGLVQEFNVSSGARVAQLPGIGTRRKMPQRGSAATSIDIGRVFLKAGNLMKVLYNQHLGKITGGDSSTMKDPPTKDFTDIASNPNKAVALFDLDSDLFYVPIGFGFVIRDRARDMLGIGYLESALIESWNLRLTAGGDMAVAEQVRLNGDRCLTIEGALTGADLHNLLQRIRLLS